MSPTTRARDGVVRDGARLAIRLLLLAAAIISGYLLSISLSGGTAVGCGPGSDCDNVLHSRWSSFVGIPVSLFALLVDGILLLATYSVGPRSSPAQRRKAWEILVPGSLLLLGAALWFVAVQAAILHRFCPWCMAAHTCGGLAAVLLLLRVPLRETAERREKDPTLPKRRAITLAIAAVLLVAMLALAQILVATRTYTIKNIALPSTNSTASASMVSASNAPAIVPKSTSAPPAVAKASAVTNPPLPGPLMPFFDVYGGAVKLDLAQVPIWGSPGAAWKLVSMHDYSCHHCAEMHSRVAEVQRAFSNRLAVLSLPMPLDRKCNPLIQRTPRDHTNACAYARLGLAVWRAQRAALAPYEDWFFGEFHRSGHPPSLTEATNQAAQLAGGLPAIEQAMRDPWIDQQLAADIAIFSISMKQFGNGSMPQFIIGTNLVSGILETAQLSNVVAKYLLP